MNTRHGFTLLEIMVALALGAVSVVLVGTVFRSVNNARTTLVSNRAALDLAMQGERTLQEAFASAAPPSDFAAAFRGNRRSIAWTATVRTAAGWTEARALRLDIKDRRLVLLGRTTSEAIADDVDSLVVRYLAGRSLDASWVMEWNSAVTMPTAVMLETISRSDDVIRSDTLLFRVGVAQ